MRLDFKTEREMSKFEARKGSLRSPERTNFQLLSWRLEEAIYRTAKKQFKVQYDIRQEFLSDQILNNSMELSVEMNQDFEDIDYASRKLKQGVQKALLDETKT